MAALRLAPYSRFRPLPYCKASSNFIEPKAEVRHPIKE